MFNLFGKKKKKDNNKTVYSEDNPLFKRFPIIGTDFEKLKISIENKLKPFLEKEEVQSLLEHNNKLPQIIVNLNRLQFESFGWKKIEDEKRFDAYVCDKTGNYLLASRERPHGSLHDMNVKQEFPMYRDWLRDQMAQNGGGLIFCETFNHKGVSGYEAIAKLPKNDGEKGMDYYYYLNIHNFIDDKIEQIRLTIKEIAAPGIREELLLPYFAELMEIEIDECKRYFYQDPYIPTYKEGNVRNAAEIELFDQLFLFHPLSIIRQIMRPRLLDSIAHLEELPEGSKDDDDIEVEFEEL